MKPQRFLKPGDVMITNDPWMGTGHIHDVNIAMPIFDKGKIVAFAAVVICMPAFIRLVRGLGMGMFRSGGDVGFMIGPPVVGFVADHMDYTAAMYANGVIMIAASVTPSPAAIFSRNSID